MRDYTRERVEEWWLSRLEDYTLEQHCSSVHGSPPLPLEQETSPCIQEVDTFILFDTFIARYPLITESACLLYCMLQRWETDHHHLSRLLKHTSNTWLRVSELVAQRDAAYATRRGADGIFYGHTHLPLSRIFGKVASHNTECWTEKPATVVTIGVRGINLEECPSQ